MDNEDIKKVQAIGNLICEDCGPNRDCELALDDCSRLSEAIDVLNGKED